MDSRMDKYNNTDIENFSRSKKNAFLYKEIYGNYSELENLPIDEHSNEMEISNLDSLLPKRSNKKIQELESSEEENLRINYDVKKEDKTKVYDINTLLEKAKEENAKIKKEELPSNKAIPNYLANLESDKQTLDLISKHEIASDDDTPIVHEIKNISKENTKSLSLDILSDLKPTGDTQVTDPIKEEEIEKEFFSGKLKFSQEDFNKEDEEEFFIEEKSNYTFLKIILIVIGLSSLFTATYFILKEYFDINLF